MKYFLYCGLLMYLFLSESVANKLGFAQVALWSSSILVFFSGAKFLQLQNKQEIVRNKIEIKIIILGLAVIFTKCLLLQFDQIRSSVLFFIFPMLFSIYLKSQDVKIKNGLRNIILIFFIVECLLAIYERVYYINIYPYKGIEESFTVQDIFFRSTSLLGHPLNNSLVVSLIMSFIINSDLNRLIKLVFVFLGFVALLCFNSRFAIVIWMILFLFHFGKQLFNNKITTVRLLLNLPFILLLFFIVYTLIANYEIGARLFNNAFFDGSAQTRLDVYESLSYIDLNTYLFGDSVQYNHIMKRLGSAGVENSFIVFIIKYGLLFFFASLFLYYLLFKNNLMNFDKFQKFNLVAAFLLVGLSNNGLMNPAVWGIYVLALYGFQINKTNQTDNSIKI